MNELYNKLIADLNTEQKAAIIKTDGPLRIIAGAGSGKTNILTKKIVYLIEYNKVKPERIIALTFSNKAAGEMKQRIKELTNEDTKASCIIATFHSICTKFLRKEINILGINNNFVILDKYDQIEILKSIFKEMNLSSQELKFSQILDFISYIKINEININDEWIKNNNNEYDLLKKEIYDKYIKITTNNHYLDFNDLLLFTEKILKNFKEIRETWQKKFDYILIDEFQDTSNLQYSIIKLFLGENNNITIVGDPDQTIYTWRGANIDLINNFDKDFKKTTTITMKQNYRSDKKIINAANKLIKYNKNRLPKSLVAHSEQDGVLQFYYGSSLEMEAKWIVEKINYLKQQKNQLKDICIIYRSNYYSRAIEEALINEAIPFKTIGSQKFFDRTEIKNCLSFLRVIFDFSEIYLLRIINVPPRKIGEISQDKIINFAKEKNITVFEAIKNHWKELPIGQEAKISLIKLFNSILKHNALFKKYEFDKVLRSFINEIEYIQSFGEEKEEGENVSRDNIEELFRSMKNWIAKNKDKNVIDYLEEISLISSQDSSSENGTNYISLMTIHASKGLEFKNVFITGLNEEIFPSYKNNDENNADEKMEEERRLAYVAITRAMNNLYISCSIGYNFSNGIKKPSRFITEMGLKIDNYIYETNEYKDDFENHFEFAIGDKVNHLTFGIGLIIEIEGEIITIQFEKKENGIKKIIKTHKSLERIINE
ncbi:MAG: ATP-dependent helicase [Metamycoplasmataceae bacterium]